MAKLVVEDQDRKIGGESRSWLEMLNAAEITGSKSTEAILGEDRCLAANRERCREAGREMYSVLARYTS